MVVSCLNYLKFSGKRAASILKLLSGPLGVLCWGRGVSREEVERTGRVETLLLSVKLHVDNICRCGTIEKAVAFRLVTARTSKAALLLPAPCIWFSVLRDHLTWLNSPGLTFQTLLPILAAVSSWFLLKCFNSTPWDNSNRAKGIHLQHVHKFHQVAAWKSKNKEGVSYTWKVLLYEQITQKRISCWSYVWLSYISLLWLLATRYLTLCHQPNRRSHCAAKAQNTPSFLDFICLAFPYVSVTGKAATEIQLSNALDGK